MSLVERPIQTSSTTAPSTVGIKAYGNIISQHTVLSLKVEMAVYLKLAPKRLVAMQPRSPQPQDSFMTDSTDVEGVVVPFDAWMVCRLERFTSELIIEWPLKVLVPLRDRVTYLSLSLWADGDERRRHCWGEARV